MEASAVPRPAPAGVSGIAASPRVLRVATDTHLVALTRQGRSAAFEAIYDRHSRAIFSFCRHMLGSAEEAEDAVQHTFLAAYNALTGSETPIHLRAWLFTIARNRCYSMLRARREHPVAELDEQPTEGLATLVQRRQDLRDLVVDLQKLPTAQREALVLSEMDALSHEQIAAVLGVPREKVKALVYQARESLLASRAARETDCAEIREQLANLRGGALRRTNLRRHLRECPGCREFRHSIERQRRHLQMIVPVIPTLALKDLIVGATVGGGGGAAIGLTGGGVLATSALKGGVLKGVLGAVLAGMGTAGTIVAVRDLPQLVGVDLFHSAHKLAPVGPALGAPRAPRLSARSGATGSVAATTPLAGHSTSGRSTAAVLSVLAPLPPARHAAAIPRAHKLSATPPPTVTGSAPSTPAPAPAVQPTTAPYLGSSAYGSGTQSAAGGTRGGGYSATGSARTSASTRPSSARGDGTTGAAPTTSSGSSTTTGTNRGPSSQTSASSAGTQSAGAGSQSGSAPSTGSAGTGSGTASTGSSSSATGSSGATTTPSSGSGAWSGGAGGTGSGSHGR